MVAVLSPNGPCVCCVILDVADKGGGRGGGGVVVIVCHVEGVVIHPALVPLPRDVTPGELGVALTFSLTVVRHVSAPVSFGSLLEGGGRGGGGGNKDEVEDGGGGSPFGGG